MQSIKHDIRAYPTARPVHVIENDVYGYLYYKGENQSFGLFLYLGQ